MRRDGGEARPGRAGRGRRLIDLAVKENAVVNERILDARGLRCPMPILKAKKEMDALGPGEILRVIATDRGSMLDFQGWAKRNPAIALLEQKQDKDETGQDVYVHLLQRKSA